MNPTVQNVYQDPLLTDVSVRYTNDELIADLVFPILPVTKRTGVYFKYDKSNLKVPKTARTGLSRANRADYATSKVPYGPLTERSLEIGIEKDVIDQAQDPLDPRTDAALAVTEMVMLERETDLAADLFSTSIVTQNVTLSGTSQWSDYANSDPFSDFQTGVSTILLNSIKRPNTAVLGQQVWDKLKNHPDLLERIKYTQVAVLTEELLAGLIGVKTVYIGSAVSNTAADGQTDSMGYIWGKSCVLLYVTNAPALRTVTAGYHFTLQDGRYIDRWVEQWNKGEFVRFNDYYDREYVAIECLYLIKNAVA